MSQRLRTLAVWLLLIVAFAAIYFALAENDAPSVPTRDDATFFADLTGHRIALVSIDRDQFLYVTLEGGEVYRTRVYYSDPIYQQLLAANIPINNWEDDRDQSSLSPLAVVGLLVVVVLVALFVFLRRVQRGGSGILELRRSTARLISETPKTRWDDVGGADEAKAYLKDCLDFLQHPAKWERTGARIPRGILLEGPPGYGKTLLAKALAGEAKLPFFEVSGSEFVELFVGVGAARVRDLFEASRKKAPCVVFIDELDAIGRKRGGAGATLTHQEREQALDQLLVCLDGFQKRDRVVVLAATNRADVLDPALLRPGRFDAILKVGDFSIEDRVAVLAVHTKGKPLAAGIDLRDIAHRTAGASGADLEHLTNQAAMTAARRGDREPMITHADFEKALSLGTRGKELDKLDVLFAEASSGVARPTTRLSVKVRLRSGQTVEGRALWADPFSLKLETSDGHMVINRAEIAWTNAAPETETVTATELHQVRTTQQPDAG